MHEQTHVEIFRHYGINSSIEWFSHFPDVVTVGDRGCPTYECVLAHNNADNIGYHLEVVLLLGGVGIYFIIFLMEEMLERKDEENNKNIN